MPLLTVDVGNYFGAKVSFDAADVIKKSALRYSCYMYHVCNCATLLISVVFLGFFLVIIFVIFFQITLNISLFPLVKYLPNRITIELVHTY